MAKYKVKRVDNGVIETMFFEHSFDEAMITLRNYTATEKVVHEVYGSKEYMGIFKDIDGKFYTVSVNK